ncbi:MAG: TetR/AcrR family transcriptional regulator [Phocaeicola sp.]|nr:TetR/AcrR family transcriptional regulator [Phocaeicola sp.]
MSYVLEQSRTDAERALLKERIVELASKAFAQRGIRQVKMDELAATMSISKRTLYELFGDKESLLMEVLIHTHHEKLQMLEEVRQNSDNVMEIIVAFYQYSIRQLEKTSLKFFEDLERYPRVREMIESSKQHNAKNVSEFFQTGIEQGIFVKDLKPEILECLFGEQMERVLRSDLVKQFTISQIFENTMLVMLRGISTAKGLEIIDKYLKERVS